MAGPVRAAGPRLNSASEPWTATFPGLGVIRVRDDGAVDVDVDVAIDGDADTGRSPLRDERRRALLYGWGEPLSFARVGCLALSGTSLAPPPGSHQDGAVLVSGSYLERAAICLGLVQRGWRLLADGIAPVRQIGDVLTCERREAPMVVGERQARASGLGFETARSGAGTAIVDAPRAPGGIPLRACAIATSRIPERDRLVQPLAGHDRFRATADLLLGGALAGPIRTPDQRMAVQLRLAGLDAAKAHASRLVHDSRDDAVIDELLDWLGAA